MWAAVQSVISIALLKFIYTSDVLTDRPFTISEPQDQEIGEFYVFQERHAPDFEVPELWKGLSETDCETLLVNNYCPSKRVNSWCRGIFFS